MSETQDTKSSIIRFSSSLKDDVWHDQSGRGAFQYWYFDALSDDGREALVITFSDSYSFSSRYFRQEKSGNREKGVSDKRFPAVSFTYSVDGKIVLRAINEFPPGEFSANRDGINRSIGRSSFRVEIAAYGPGFLLEIDLLTPRKCRLKAQLEWLSIEADLKDHAANDEAASASWNIVAPRSDVSGRITVEAPRGKAGKLFHFRGTGYHDHFRSDRSLAATVGQRCWGRAHFVDSTAVFHRYQNTDSTEALSKLFLVREGSIHERDVSSEVQNPARDRYGLKIPRRFSFVSDDNMRLRVKPMRAIHSGFFEKSMLSEITLMLRDGKPRKTTGIIEFIVPGRMKNPLFRWLADMRVGRNGRSPLF